MISDINSIAGTGLHWPSFWCGVGVMASVSLIASATLLMLAARKAAGKAEYAPVTKVSGHE